MHIPYKRSSLCLILLPLIISTTAMAADDKVKLSDIEVVGTTPLHGVGLPADVIPANVQTANSDDIAKSQSLDLSDFIDKSLGSVNINSAQNNPYQPDVQYRGYSASPLLGLPQGLAVYMDGVRLNAPFGDNIHWDTIPQAAIASINLMPGSNPVFGLNTLGGALSIESKNGFTNPGNSIQGYFGSYNRRAGEFESGASADNLSYYVTGNWFKEDSWRDKSPTDVKQIFTNLGWHNANSKVNLTFNAADNELYGNGSSPVELIDQSRAAVFTYPDITTNRLQLVNLQGSHWFNDEVMASGNAYYRHNKTGSFNGDGSDYDEGSGVNLGKLVDDDGLVKDQNGNSISSDFDAINNRGDITENSGGFGLQLTFLNDLLGYQNQLVTGVSYDQGDSDYQSSVEVAKLTDDRGTTKSGLYVPDEAVSVNSKNRTYGLFFTNTLSFTDALNLTLSGRYNNTRIKVKDHLDGSSSVNATHRYNRFNPAAGLTYAINNAMTTYLSYSESSRAPTPSELGCSDPDAPCKLPNAFLADPPLKQVVAKSWEAGLRGSLYQDIKWNAGVFTATNHDDILFISTGGSTGNTGYFSNVGETRRRGVELGMSGKQAKLRWSINYSYIEAQFRTPLTINSPSHPDRDGNDDIKVKSGDNIPSIPKHNLKFATDYDFTNKLAMGLNAIINSDQYYRGDESNQLGKIAGYAVFNLNADYKISKNIKLFAKVDNVFDRDYANFGVLGEPGEVIAGFDDPRFQGVGAPRTGLVGIKITM